MESEGRHRARALETALALLLSYYRPVAAEEPPDRRIPALDMVPVSDLRQARTALAAAEAPQAVNPRRLDRFADHIEDRCPACGAQSLFIGVGGWLTCGVIGCKEPGVSAYVKDLQQRAEAAEARAAQLLAALAAAEAPQADELLARIRSEVESMREGCFGLDATAYDKGVGVACDRILALLGPDAAQA